MQLHLSLDTYMYACAYASASLYIMALDILFVVAFQRNEGPMTMHIHLYVRYDADT